MAGQEIEQEKTPEQMADFAALEAIAEPERIEEADEPSGEYIASDESQAVDTVANLAGILEIFSAMADATGYRKTAQVWNAETRQRVSVRTVPVLQKTEFGRKVMAFINSGLGLEEMALAAVLFPAIKATRDAMIADAQAQQRAAQEVERAA